MTFERRDLPAAVAAVRDEYAPGAVVVDCERDFQTLPPAVAEDLALLVDAVEPASYPASWLPDDAPELLGRYAGGEFTVGTPGDGSVAWTRRTDPPVVVVKPRIEGSPEAFVAFLLAEALVQVGLEVPEDPLAFFEARYRDLDRAVPLDPTGTYQVAAALAHGRTNVETRSVFETWPEERPRLGTAWADAGRRLEARVERLPSAVARGETDPADAVELACAAIKHDLDLPAPFAALATDAYRHYGPEYAVRWAEKTFETAPDAE